MAKKKKAEKKNMPLKAGRIPSAKIAKAEMPKVVYRHEKVKVTFEFKLVKYLADGSSIVEVIRNGGEPHREYISEGQTLSFSEMV